MKPVMLTVGGGKGGIGKSMITANLGMVMARLGHSTLVIDADLGGSDLHNLLGMDNYGPGLGELLTQRGLKISDLPQPIREPRLYFIPGDACLPAATNPRFQRKRKLFHDINRLPHEFVFLDLGAGSSITVTDFFLSSPFSLLIMTPERAAELNVFNFFKNLVYRLLAPLARNNNTFAGQLALFQKRRLGPGSGAINILRENLAEDFKAKVNDLLKSIKPKLLLNRLRKIDEFIQAQQVQAWVRDDLGLEVEIIGFLPEDEIVMEAARSGVPALDIDPRAPFCRALALLGYKLSPWAGKPEDWLQAGAAPESFTRAATEFAPFFPTPR